MAHFSLSWDAYKSNICKGLSALQQNGEFVDMTLAADGHHVKVHQMVMSLASPYIKEIITSTQCQHPVIFLNKMSYTTLCAILEYIYTGEVLISKDNLNQVIEAARELHIKGLEDMKTLDISATETYTHTHSAQALAASFNAGQPLDSSYQTKDPDLNDYKVTRSKEKKKEIKEAPSEDDFRYEETYLDISANDSYDAMETDNMTENVETVSVGKVTEGGDPQSQVQYTLSSHGSLQMILNRYLYNLRYTSRRDPSQRQWRCIDLRDRKCQASVITRGETVVSRLLGHGEAHHVQYNLRYTSRRDPSQRQWRCIDLRDRKCQASVITRGETVVSRVAAHSHPFHDQKILKKVRDKAIFSAIRDAENISASKQAERAAQLQRQPNKSGQSQENTDIEYAEQESELLVV